MTQTDSTKHVEVTLLLKRKKRELNSHNVRVDDVGLANSDPDLFLKNNPVPLFLDEIQYAPNLLNALKREMPSDFVNTVRLGVNR